MSNYNHYKSLYESIKPIRGRAVDVRPLGKRSRDWETIRMDGDVVECVLYKTPVVRYYPDGRIGLQCDSWVTTSTAEFMYEHSPFVCRKRNHKIQVNPTGKYQDDAKYYPLPNHSETVFVLTSDNKYAPSAPLVEHKQVIDRKLAKEAREPFMPFVNFVETFLKMSDGWLMHETREQVGKLDTYRSYFNRACYDYGLRGGKEVLTYIEEAQEEDYLRVMCMFLDGCAPKSHQLVKSYEVDMGEEPHMYKKTLRFYDTQYNHKTVKSKLYRMIAKDNNVHETKTVTHE